MFASIFRRQCSTNFAQIITLLLADFESDVGKRLPSFRRQYAAEANNFHTNLTVNFYFKKKKEENKRSKCMLKKNVLFFTVVAENYT